MRDVRVSVVIPSRDNTTYLSNALESLYETLRDDDEIIVVANGTPEEIAVTEGYVKALAGSRSVPTRALVCSTPGYTAATNLGLRAAQGDFIVMTNDDIICAPRWADRMIGAFLDAQKDAPETKWGYAGPRSNNAFPLQMPPRDKLPEAYDAKFRHITSEKLAKQRSWAPIGFLSGFCLMITRECLKDVGYLDEEYPGGGFSDNDWAVRAQDAGYLGILAGQAFVYHIGHTSMDKYTPGHSGGVENMQIYMRKWYRPREQSLGVCYRVKIDKAEDMAAFCKSVEAASFYAESIVILDDRSSIDVMAQLTSFGLAGKVKDFQQNAHDTPFDEVRDRNRIIQMIRAHKPDWILNLDHDEVISENLTKEKLQQLLNPVDIQCKGYFFPIYTFWRGKTHVRLDGTWGTMNLGVLFKNDPCFGDIHQTTDDGTLHCRRIPTYIPLDVMKPTQAFVIKHYGYESIDRAAEKQVWYQANDRVKDKELIGTENYEHLTDESKLQLYPYSKPTFTVVMLNKNEGLAVAKQIKTWRDYADDMVIVDTGCTDGTPDFARMMGVRVVEYRCCEHAEEKGHLICDFSAGRNFGLDQVKTDYVFYVDPDEDAEDPIWTLLPRYLLKRSDVYTIERMVFLQTPAGLKPKIDPQPILFKMDPRLRYSRPVHESIEPAIEEHLKDISVEETAMRLRNWTFVNDTGPAREAKLMQYAERLMDMLEKDPTDAIAWHALGTHMIDIRLFDEGDQHIAQAIACKPWFFEARYLLATRYVQRAIELLLAAPGVKPDQSTEATKLIQAGLPFCRNLRWPDKSPWAKPARVTPV